MVVVVFLRFAGRFDDFRLRIIENLTSAGRTGQNLFDRRFGEGLELREGHVSKQT